MHPSSGRRAVLASLTLALATIVGAGQAASGLSPVNHEEPIITGDVGVHILIDGGEPYAGVTCRYESGQLVGFRIRRPIALQDGADQPIGWRYSIEGTDDPDPFLASWTSRFTSPLVKRTATDRQPAPFSAVTKNLTGLGQTWYRVIVRLFWYRPADHKDGKALIAVESYENDDGSSTWVDACPSDETGTSAAVSVPPDPDTKDLSGIYGVNLLIDESDDWSYSGAGCSYQGGQLHRIAIRRPIAFPDGQKQTIGWRYVIEGTNDTLTPDAAEWTFVKRGPLHKAVARPPQPAPFLPDVAILDGPLAWDLYRVVVRVWWYRPASTVEGHSYMAVESYDDGPHTDEDETFTYGCPATHP